MIYFALIGDIIDSKMLDNRYEVQESLQACLNRINKKYADSLVSQFSITLGDEFQGLLKLQAPIFQIIDEIKFSLTAVDLRFGLGLGRILTEIDPEQSIGADGPAYWLARQAIERIHQKNDYGTTQLAVCLADVTTQEMVNSLIAASEAIRANWRESQEVLLKTLLALNCYDEQFDQQVLGHYLQLSSSALSKRLKSSSLKVYLRARKSALTLLQAAGKDKP